MRQLDVWLNRRRVGVLDESGDLWRFSYDREWMEGPNAFDLSPGLPRAAGAHEDGGSNRPVQWYFDNLLPEEQLREVLSKDADIKGDDAFALLEYLGAESAGSLVLLPPGQEPAGSGSLQPLSDQALSQRIRDLPRASLSKGAPKRMSLAGAQNKLPVVFRDGELFEPVSGEPSTHILKPAHLSDDYAGSVINEFFSMSLADLLGVPVPKVYRRYVPEPVYIVERFDRYRDNDGVTQRVHIIDACQLLNKARTFKVSSANLETLRELAAQCRVRPTALMRIYRWLVFNVLVGNDDNHLKNLSFVVSEDGISVSNHYDLLSTAVYHTRAFADERATWQELPMTIPLPGAPTFGRVTRQSVLAAGQELGIPAPACKRMLDTLVQNIGTGLPMLVDRVMAANDSMPGMGPEEKELTGRVLRTIQHVVVPDMLAKVR